MESKTIFPLLQIENVLECRIIRRANRFVVAISVNGNEYRACINNTGRLTEFLVPGTKGFCSKNEKQGKTDYRLFAIAESGMSAVIDTQFQMRAFERAAEMRLIPWLAEYKILRRNAPLGSSLIDYLLEHNGKRVYLEVKSAALRDDAYAMYPDCPTARGRRHIKELTEYACRGGDAFILFMAALPDVSAFRPYKQGDPALYELLVEADKSGVRIKSMEIAYSPKDSGIHLINSNLDIDLS